MRRGQVVVLAAGTSGLLSVLLAVAVNVATGGSLPPPLDTVTWLAWPAVGLLAAVTVTLAIWQQRLATRPAPTPDASAPTPGTAERSGGTAGAGAATGRGPAELPAVPAELAGRGDDLAALDRHLAAGTRVLVLAGPPGVGKSTLALHLAHRLRADHPDGQLYAALRGASADPASPRSVLHRFLGALGVPADERRGDADDLAARFRSATAGRRLLILLDDARDAGQVRQLLPAGPACLVLVTSRWLPGDLPAVVHQVGALPRPEALALLAAAAGADRVAADPTGSPTSAAASTSCTWGTPRYARASRRPIRTCPLRTGWCSGGSAATPARRQAPGPWRPSPVPASGRSPRAWSGSSTRTWWSRRPAAGTGCTTCCGCTPPSGWPPRRRQPTGTPAPTGCWTGWRPARPPGRRPAAGQGAAEAEHALLRAMALFTELRDVDSEIEVRTALASLYNTFHRHQDATAMAGRALELLPDQPGYRHAWALLQLATAAKFLGRPEEADRLVARVVELAMRIDDRFVLAYALQERGWRHLESGRPADATRDMQAMADLCTRIQHGTGVATAQDALGAIAMATGDVDGAFAAFDAAIAGYLRLHDTLRAGQSRLSRAVALATAGRGAEASAEWAAAERLLDGAAPPGAVELRARLRALIDAHRAGGPDGGPAHR